MRTVTVGQLRQNPTSVLAEVEAGATYEITRHGHVIGHIVPPADGGGAVAPKQAGPAHTRALERVALTSAPTIDALLAEIKGGW